MLFLFLPLWEAGDSQAPSLAVIGLALSVSPSLACVWGMRSAPLLENLNSKSQKSRKVLVFTDVLSSVGPNTTVITCLVSIQAVL